VPPFAAVDGSAVRPQGGAALVQTDNTSIDHGDTIIHHGNDGDDVSDGSSAVMDCVASAVWGRPL
jgi:hypothetical protein